MTMQKVILDGSIACNADLENVGHGETVPFIFTADENWPGVYAAKVFNSEVKNTEHPIGDALTIVDKVMTFTVKASEQNLAPTKYYYEITDTQNKRIVFKGSLNIVK